MNAKLQNIEDNLTYRIDGLDKIIKSANDKNQRQQ